MTQLIVSLNEDSLTAEIKKAIMMLRGVEDVQVRKDKALATTMNAIAEMRSGDTLKCENFEEYLRLVGDDIQN